ncbi:MAG: VWA domain-containing protein [Candidatus Omnitrophota bacterium]
MNWALPVFLNLLILIPILVIFFIFVAKSKERSLRILGDMEVVKKISFSKDIARDHLKALLIILASFFLIISIARPQIGSRLVMNRRSGIDIIAAIDTSLSMKAQDIKPARLDKAKLELGSFIDKLKGDRIGILTFSGDSFVQCPLTLDYNAAKLFLDVIEVGIIPKPGTAIGEAIKKAVDSFVKKETKYKVLVLLTDGEDHESDPLGAGRLAKKEGVIIYTIGIGTKQGEPVPLIDGSGNVSGYKKDTSGEVVISKLDDSTLQRIAVMTGGKYYNATPSEFELENIYEDISKMERKELSGRLFTQYEDRFQYFLAIALILVCLEFLIGDRKKNADIS